MIHIVVPCFNEEERFDCSYWSYIIEHLPRDICFFHFVDDGSNDNTKSMLQKFVDENASNLIVLNSNVGKANALRHSFELLSKTGQAGDIFGFIDSDSAFNSEEVIDRIMKVEQDIVGLNALFMSRIKLSGTKIIRSARRHIFSRLIYTYLARGWDWAPYDTQCGFKFFMYSDDFCAALRNRFTTKWFFDIELIVRLTLLTGNRVSIKEIPLRFWTERQGSKLRGQEIIRIVFEILKIRKKIRKIIHL